MGWCALGVRWLLIVAAAWWAAHAFLTPDQVCAQATTCETCYALYQAGSPCGYFTSGDDSGRVHACVAGTADGPTSSNYSLSALQASYEFGFCCSLVPDDDCAGCVAHAPTCGFDFTRQDATCGRLPGTDLAASCDDVGSHEVLMHCSVTNDIALLERDMAHGETAFVHVIISSDVHSLTVGDQGEYRHQLKVYTSYTVERPSVNSYDAENSPADDNTNVTMNFDNEQADSLYIATTCLAAKCKVELRQYCVPPTDNDIYYILGIGIGAQVALGLGLCIGATIWTRLQRVRMRGVTELHEELTRSDMERRLPPQFLTYLPPRKRRRAPPAPMDAQLEMMQTAMFAVIGPQDLETLRSRPNDPISPNSRPITAAASPQLNARHPLSVPSPAASPTLVRRNGGAPTAATVTSAPAPPPVTQKLVRLDSQLSLGSIRSEGTEARLNVLAGLEQLFIAVRIINEDGPPYLLPATPTVASSPGETVSAPLSAPSSALPSIVVDSIDTGPRGIAASLLLNGTRGGGNVSVTSGAASGSGVSLGGDTSADRSGEMSALGVDEWSDHEPELNITAASLPGIRDSPTME